MESWLQSLLHGNQLPVITAFVLGLLTAISPCPMATNITAIGYITKDIKSNHRIFINGLLYALGRILSYTLLAGLLIYFLQKGMSIFHIQKNITHYGELIIGPLLLLIGLFLLFLPKMNLPSLGWNPTTFRSKTGYGALGLGVVFALAFCPTSAFFYFGTLIPLATQVPGGIFLPIVYALATALPVLIIAWVLAYSVKNIGNLYNKLKQIERILRIAVAFLFIGMGLYTLWSLFS